MVHRDEPPAFIGGFLQPSIIMTGTIEDEAPGRLEPLHIHGSIQLRDDNEADVVAPGSGCISIGIGCRAVFVEIETINDHADVIVTA